MNKFEYLIFDLCLAYCSLCLSSTIQKEIYLGECGHSFCIPCYNKIFGHKKVETSAFFYGCNPCPNNCLNPRKGIQCTCVEYSQVIEEWSKNKHHEYNQWKAKENMYNYKKSKKRIVKICPICIPYRSFEV
jgi:hypothetical protein